jgi:hypothetical protein
LKKIKEPPLTDTLALYLFCHETKLVCKVFEVTVTGGPLILILLCQRTGTNWWFSDSVMLRNLEPAWVLITSMNRLFCGNNMSLGWLSTTNTEFIDHPSDCPPQKQYLFNN